MIDREVVRAKGELNLIFILPEEEREHSSFNISLCPEVYIWQVA